MEMAAKLYLISFCSEVGFGLHTRAGDRALFSVVSENKGMTSTLAIQLQIKYHLPWRVRLRWQIRNVIGSHRREPLLRLGNWQATTRRILKRPARQL
jgi:hypothetical protein